MQMTEVVQSNFGGAYVHEIYLNCLTDFGCKHE